jgi:hypothetical protein
VELSDLHRSPATRPAGPTASVRGEQGAPGGTASVSAAHARTVPVPTIASLLFALGVLSAFKGLTTYVDQTAAYLYHTDYRFGFVARGLVGQLFSPLLAATPPGAHRWVLVAWHYATLALLLALLARFAARAVAAAGGRADVLAMAALVFCSPLVPSLANFTAAPDVLLCLLTLGVVAAVRAGRLGAAWALFVAGVLAHQLMLFLALPLMVLACLLAGGDRRWAAAAVSLAVGAAASLAVVLAPAPDERFVGVFVATGIPPGAARSLFEDQLGQTTGRMLGAVAELWRDHTLNGLIAVAYGAGAGVVLLATCLLSPGAVRAAAGPLDVLPAGRARAAVAVLLVVGAGLSPLLVLALAYDLSRLAALATFTSLVAAGLVLLRAGPGAGPARRGGTRAAAIVCGALAVAFLCLPFLGLWFEAGLAKRDELLVPNPVLEFGPTRALVERFLAFYGRDAP